MNWRGAPFYFLLVEVDKCGSLLAIPGLALLHHIMAVGSYYIMSALGLPKDSLYYSALSPNNSAIDSCDQESILKEQ